MKVYRLYYVLSNNGETGVTQTYDIVQTTDKGKIDRFVSENGIVTVDGVERGQSKVFVCDSYEFDVMEYVRPDRLELARKDLEQTVYKP